MAWEPHAALTFMFVFFFMCQFHADGRWAQNTKNRDDKMYTERFKRVGFVFFPHVPMYIMCLFAVTQ